MSCETDKVEEKYKKRRKSFQQRWCFSENHEGFSWLKVMREASCREGGEGMTVRNVVLEWVVKGKTRREKARQGFVRWEMKVVQLAVEADVRGGL